jgi:hypothetical protein
VSIYASALKILPCLPEFSIPPFHQCLILIFKIGKSNAAFQDDSDNYKLSKVMGGITNAAQRRGKIKN